MHSTPHHKIHGKPNRLAADTAVIDRERRQRGTKRKARQLLKSEHKQTHIGLCCLPRLFAGSRRAVHHHMRKVAGVNLRENSEKRRRLSEWRRKRSDSATHHCFQRLRLLLVVVQAIQCRRTVLVDPE